jgi:hypothetical protein
MGTSKKNAISVNELVTIVSNVKCCQFCQLSYGTPVESLNKKLKGGQSNRYYGHVSSITSMSGVQINANYENAVNNRLPKGDGDGERFVAESLPWGEWLIPNKVIIHKGKYYLRLYVTKSVKKTTSYYIDGVKSNENIGAEIRESKPSARQAEVGIDEKDMVKPFTICADNVSEITLNGVTYNIVKF